MASLDVEAVKHLRMNGGGEPLEYVKVQDLVTKYFSKAEEKNKMVAITEKGLSDAIQQYIEKDEKDAISELINYQINKIQTYLKNEVNWQNEFQLEEEIRNFQKIRLSNIEEEDKELKEIFEKSRKNTQNSTKADDSFDMSSLNRKNVDSDEDDEEIKEKSNSGHGRGSRRGAASSRGRGSRTTRAARGKKTAPEESSYFQSFPSQIKKEKNSINSDNALIDLEADQKPIKSMTTTPSVRRTRIQYEDDEDEYINSKKTKILDSNLEDDDISNTFSIFKKVAKKK